MTKKWGKNVAQYGLVEERSKSKWRRLLLQFETCSENRSSEVEYQQYWTFITHVSIL